MTENAVLNIPVKNFPVVLRIRNQVSEKVWKTEGYAERIRTAERKGAGVFFADAIKQW